MLGEVWSSFFCCLSFFLIRFFYSKLGVRISNGLNVLFLGEVRIRGKVVRVWDIEGV